MSRRKNFNLSQNLAVGQLPMFMTGREIQQHFRPLEGDREEIYNREKNDTRKETDTELWTRKLDESRNNSFNPRENKFGFTSARSLSESIKEHGVQNPVSLQLFTKPGTSQVLGGHHRIAVMAAEHPNKLMPVEFYESWGHAKNDKGPNY